MARIDKQLERAKRIKRQQFKEQLKQFDAPKQNTIADSTKRQEMALDYYNSLTDEQKVVFNKELEKKRIRESYIDYLKYVYPNYKVTRFHALLANVCQSIVEKVENGQKVRICFSCPPQHGKSISVTETLPSWFLGRNPDMRAILTAYNADIAEKFGDRNRQLVKEHGKNIFNIEISESQDNKTLWDLSKHRGGLYSAGILGGITSNTSQLTIVDDPYKNGIEADNPEIRQKVYDTFVDSILTRSQGKGNAVIVIHTRWNDDDLIGRLVKLGWIYINIPCICEGEDKLLNRKVGETLCPDLGFDADWALTMQQALGKRKWNALYQGKPFIDGGNIIKRADINFYNKMTEPSSYEELVLSCDLSFGGTKKVNDPYCMTLWGRNGANHYLLKIFDKRASFTDTARTIQIICNEYPELRKKIIEKKANGQATMDALGKEIGGLVPFDPKGTSKEDRLNRVSAYFEAGNIYFPDETIFKDIETYVEQLLRFPSCEHDDFVDTISQYLLNYEYRYGGKVDTDNRFAMFAKAIRGF